MLLEDYGLIGDMQAAALVGRTGAVDWLCLPRFDSASCFSALLGDDRHGRWSSRRPVRFGRVLGATGPERWCSRPTSKPRRARSDWLISCRAELKGFRA